MANDTIRLRFRRPDIFNFETVIERCWRNRKLLFPYIAMCVLLGVAYMHVAEPSYTVKATVAPAPDQSGGLGGMAAGLLASAGSSGLSSLLGSTSDDHFQAFLTLLQSNRLATKLASNDDILRTVFYERWDADAHQWNNGPLRQVANVVKGILGLQVKAAPDADDLYEFLNDELVIKRSFQNSLVEVDLNFRDPAAGARIMNAILYDADSIVRQDSYRDVSARLLYLEKHLPTITVADQREAIITVLSGQQQSMMMIHADALYASTLIDTPRAPSKPSWPNLVLVLILSVIIATILWLVTALTLKREVRIVPQLERNAARTS